MSSVLREIYQVVGLLPSSALSSLVETLSSINATYTDTLASNILQPFSNIRFRRAIDDLLKAWRDDSSINWSSRELAAAIISAANTATILQQELAADLVWTGPSSSVIPIRRTDQVLLQLINECQHSLTLISFAIYKVPEIVEAILAALDRGVALCIIAETPESGEGKISFGLQATFGTEIMNRSQVLVWPKEKRPVDLNGKYGSLHIKGAISDRERLFVTSANLTEYALSLNMELGVLMKNERLAQQFTDQIEHLVQGEILIPLTAQ